ncbi:F-box-like protein [Ceratobasidium sp. AG-Ba]|nr:F-box-like protein [Ceratobasidium sp. AG-Ba]
MEPFSSALQHWRDMSSCLSTAIKNFHASFRELEAAISHSPTSSPALEHVISELLDSKATLASSVKSLESVDALINRICNKSSHRVPIHSLTDDIFSNILTLVVRASQCLIEHKRKDHRAPEEKMGHVARLQLVCSRWHRVVTSTPLCWSHVDVFADCLSNDGSPISEVTLYHLQFASTHSIHLHFHWSATYVPEPHLVSFLEEHLARISSIRIDQTTRGQLFESVAEAYIDYAQPLVLELSRGHSITHPLNQNSNGLGAATFRTIRHLRIGRPKYSDDPVYIDNLVAMLNNSPSLRSLRLHDIPLDVDDHAPIYLPHLELLEFSPTCDNFNFLPKIITEATVVDLRLRCPSSRNEFLPVESFLQRSSVRSLTLMLGSSLETARLEECVECVPQLHALYIEYFDAESVSSKDVVPLLLIGQIPAVETIDIFNSSEWPCTPKFPNLKVFGIIGTEMWTEYLLKPLAPLVSAYSLDTLVLAGRYKQLELDCLPETWDWMISNVGSISRIRKKEGFEADNDEWDAFADKQLKGLRAL